MGLELVGDAKKGDGQGPGTVQGTATGGPGHGRISEPGGGNPGAESLAAVENALGAARQRLSVLADRLAELRRRLDPAGADSRPSSR